jgi:2-keto-3-deoxy-L-rhamnonate aldolase RhmA
MLDLLTITNALDLAQRCDAMPGMRLFVDLERNGKAERQKGHDTFISTHQVEDVGKVKAVLKHSKLMVRVNPLQMTDPAASKSEVDAVLAQGADLIMLPMFTNAAELQAFARIVAGRVPIVPLLETAGALQSLDEWIDTAGIGEIFIGLNDLHLSLGCRFMFEPLLMGHVDRVASAAKSRGLRFGFGGIARMQEGALPGKAVLAEHLRLGSGAVILSRSFNRAAGDFSDQSFEQAVAQLRQAEAELSQRSLQSIEEDRFRTAALIGSLASATKAIA